MRKFVMSAMALCATLGLTLAAEVAFVKFDKEKKELTVKEGDKEKVYKITKDTKFKQNDKDVEGERAMGRFEKMKDGTKMEITVEKDKDTLTEIKMMGRGGAKKN
jgi:hypothetical protein